jgi:hypothetical protein
VTHSITEYIKANLDCSPHIFLMLVGVLNEYGIGPLCNTVTSVKIFMNVCNICMFFVGSKKIDKSQ